MTARALGLAVARNLTEFRQRKDACPFGSRNPRNRSIPNPGDRKVA